MRKNLLLLLIISVTIVLTYLLVKYIGVKGFLFAWTLNFMLMMCVFMFTETLKSKFKSSYYNQKKWEASGKIYLILGIHIFRKLLVWTGWEKFNKKANPVEKNISALEHLFYRTKQSELGHLIIFFIVLLFNVCVAIKLGFIESIWLSILNILLNLYPILLQRYNRPRLERAILLSKYKAEKLISYQSNSTYL